MRSFFGHIAKGPSTLEAHCGLQFASGLNDKSFRMSTSEVVDNSTLKGAKRIQASLGNKSSVPNVFLKAFYGLKAKTNHFMGLDGVKTHMPIRRKRAHTPN